MNTISHSSASRRCSQRFPASGALFPCDAGAPSQTATTPARAPSFHHGHTVTRLLASAIYVTICALTGTTLAWLGTTIMEATR